MIFLFLFFLFFFFLLSLSKKKKKPFFPLMTRLSQLLRFFFFKHGRWSHEPFSLRFSFFLLFFSPKHTHRKKTSFPFLLSHAPPPSLPLSLLSPKKRSTISFPDLYLPKTTSFLAFLERKNSSIFYFYKEKTRKCSSTTFFLKSNQTLSSRRFFIERVSLSPTCFCSCPRRGSLDPE